MPVKDNQIELIEYYKQVHGDKFDYSKVNYVNSTTKITVICKIHGEFGINPKHHKNGVGCKKCYFESKSIKKSEFLIRAINHFGDIYDYTHFEVLPARNEKVPIKCKTHNIVFLQEPRNHMRGHTGCPQCKLIKLTGKIDGKVAIRTQKQLNEIFIEEAKKVHSNRYDYSEFIYVKSNANGKIICKEHGEFWQTPSNHLKGTNCPLCSKVEKNKNTFKKLCKEKNINYYRALKRRQSGHSDEKIFNEGYIRNERETTIVKVLGKEYPNIEEAIRQLNPPASSKTIGRWISEGLSAEEAFVKIPNPGYANGIIYLITNSLNSKKYVGLTVQALKKRWQYHTEQAFTNNIKSLDSLHAAIRQYGAEVFKIEQIDSGTTKVDLESKEKKWIKELGTLVPNGYNISTGGVSGGSTKRPISIDKIRFNSVGSAAKYLSESRNISLDAAKKRISVDRIYVKTPAKKGESLIKTPAYKAWSRIVHGQINPKSKDYKPEIILFENWKIFDIFLKDVGNPSEKGMSFTRLDQSKGYYPENCVWVSKSESSKINAEYMNKTGKFKKKNVDKKNDI